MSPHLETAISNLPAPLAPLTAENKRRDLGKHLAAARAYCSFTPARVPVWSQVKFRRHYVPLRAANLDRLTSPAGPKPATARWGDGGEQKKASMFSIESESPSAFYLNPNDAQSFNRRCQCGPRRSSRRPQRPAERLALLKGRRLPQPDPIDHVNTAYHSEGLSPGECNQLRALLAEFKYLFAAKDSKCTRTHITKHDINTGIATSIRQRTRRLSLVGPRGSRGKERRKRRSGGENESGRLRVAAASPAHIEDDLQPAKLQQAQREDLEVDRVLRWVLERRGYRNRSKSTASQSRVLQLVYGPLGVGHIGVNKTLYRLRQHFYWGWCRRDDESHRHR
ncbi:hypothetical protein SKAU_G00033940 [Synaphobranchus kaupii]|uniref:Integrase zinc-binding domain-containing protein n=1 Tax=Synaphobranchus kaupii TaxID=118154 RepID=A0A9Q1JDG5_SYNKA|nr:hypothetical protein SKAU_G00033940 [Synaphobranchus kaupii]